MSRYSDTGADQDVHAELVIAAIVAWIILVLVGGWVLGVLAGPVIVLAFALGAIVHDALRGRKRGASGR